MLWRVDAALLGFLAFVVDVSSFQEIAGAMNPLQTGDKSSLDYLGTQTAFK
jgi:hypothetical protein